MHQHLTATARPRIRALAAAVVAVLVAACGGADAGTTADGTPSDDREGVAEQVSVVATTTILGDIVKQLVGDDGAVHVLMPPGVDPHAYQPSATDAAMLRDVDLVVVNGLGLEESLRSALAAAEGEGVRVVEVADELDPIGFEAAADDHDDGHDDDGHDDDGHDDDGHDDDGHDDDAHGAEDPHVWFDPVRMTDGVDLIAAELAGVWPAIDGDEWQARADAYNEQLLAVHDEMIDLFAAIPEEHRKLVTNHDALGYLAARYDLEIIGTVVPGSSTQVEADARQFASLIETVEQAGVDVIFAENTDSVVLAEQLASEVIGRSDLDVEVVRIYTDALGEGGSGAETYLGLLRTTAELISDALR